MAPPTTAPLGAVDVNEMLWLAGCCCGALYVNAPLDVTVPPNAVTEISTAPADPAGATAVIWVALFTINDVAATVPKRTDAAPLKLVPVMVTLVPPAIAPLFGETEPMVGAAIEGEVKTNLLFAFDIDDPAGEVIVTPWVPISASTGVTTVICVGLTTENDVPFTFPNRTAVALLKFVPVIVTVVPPLFGPEAGETAEIAGSRSAIYVAALTRVAVPAAVVTATSTGPTVPAGAIMESTVPPWSVMEVPGTPLKVTEVTPIKLVPKTVTLPPSTEIFDGVTEEMVGAEGNAT